MIDVAEQSFADETTARTWSPVPGGRSGPRQRATPAWTAAWPAEYTAAACLTGACGTLVASIVAAGAVRVHGHAAE